MDVGKIAPPVHILAVDDCGCSTSLQAAKRSAIALQSARASSALCCDKWHRPRTIHPACRSTWKSRKRGNSESLAAGKPDFTEARLNRRE